MEPENNNDEEYVYPYNLSEEEIKELNDPIPFKPIPINND